MNTRKNPSILSWPLLALACALPAWAAPPIDYNVTIDYVRPLVNDDFIYLTMAGDDQYDPPAARLAVDLRLTNNEAYPVKINGVLFDFDQPNISSISRSDAGLMMYCSGVLSIFSGSGNIIMPAGGSCRLALTPDPILSLPAPAKLRIVVYYDGVLTPGEVSERDLEPYENATPTGAYRFPARRDNLPAGAFWEGSSKITGIRNRFTSLSGDDNVYGYDLSVIRYDESEGWVDYADPEPGETGSEVDDELEDYLAWGQPVYAMAGGIVKACNSDEEDHPLGLSGGIDNYIVIETGDERVYYGHFQENSIDPAICDVDAEVEEGDFLGFVGNSGGTGGFPNLHVHVTSGGDPRPLQFNDCVSIERNTAFADPPSGNAEWVSHRGFGLSTAALAIWPSALVRRGQATDVDITEVAMVDATSTRTLTASRTVAGNLKVSLWSTGADGEADHLDDVTGGGVDYVALAKPTGSQDGALAMITAAGNLKISALDVVGGGILERTANFDSEAVTAVAVAPAPFWDGIATATIRLGNLKVMAWKVDSDGDSIEQRDDATASAAKSVALVQTVGFPGVVAAIRDGGDDLRLLSFEIVSSGNSVTFEDDYVDDEVEQVSIARVGERANGDDLLVTACVNGAGDLELDSWSVDGSGTITKLEEMTAGAIDEVSIAGSIATQEHVLTAIGDNYGNFKLIAWHVADDGTFTRRADSQGGAATKIVQGEVEGQLANLPTMAVTAMIDSLDELRLVVHQVNLDD